MFAKGVENNQEPTSITLSYYDQLQGSELEVEVGMMYNAVFLFANASNLKQIVFQYNEQQRVLDRVRLQDWLGFPINHRISEKIFLKCVNQKLEAMSFQYEYIRLRAIRIGK